ncbi:hypothetical protein BHE74_00010053 [Ensete ventricosum]|nr:hypothetical protein GW17_00017636 [Ensete ventricosum]RWW81523.1 hypothetical protein BHE74_00010053 [Ensete ventricosum]RZS03280.1 hypothetical protein BHM03_00033461 [Ensete ventricosum]
MGASRMDHSFVVLPKQKYQGHGVPPRPRSTTPQPDNSHSAKAIEESYVVLPPAAASMYKSELTPEEGGSQQRVQGGSPSSGLQIVEEERRLQAEIEEIEKHCLEVNAELKEVQMKSKEFKELEERYWHEFNSFQFQLISHQLVFSFFIDHSVDLQVEWDEINAAWGQACLLLHTMAQHFRPKFLYLSTELSVGSLHVFMLLQSIYVNM